MNIFLFDFDAFNAIINLRKTNIIIRIFYEKIRKTFIIRNL